MTKNASQLARLRWHCRRGMLELDVILQQFFDNHYLQLNPADQLLFERLLTAQDQELYEWLMGKKIPTDPEFKNMVQRILASR